MHYDRPLTALRKIAESHGGELLSQHYKGSQVKLQFKCVAGHTWMTTPAAVNQGKWCRECFYEKLRKPKTCELN
jgi:hypothetical protein